MNKQQTSVAVAFALFVLGHLFATVWWASKITTKQEYVILQIVEVKQRLCELNEHQYKKDDAKRDLAIRDDLRVNLSHRIEALETEMRKIVK